MHAVIGLNRCDFDPVFVRNSGHFRNADEAALNQPRGRGWVRNVDGGERDGAPHAIATL